jgi:APA family basic amino acid/polyamine antiporter
MIGAGVYTSSGFALGDLGSKWLVLSVWVVAGVIALIGAVCYGRLARWITVSGGEYLFLSRAVHPFVGFLAGWISLTAGFSGAIAYSAITFNVYLPAESWLGTFPAGVIPVGLILVFGIFHLFGVSVGTGIQNVMVAIKLIFLIGFTLFGLYVISSNFGVAVPAIEVVDVVPPVAKTIWEQLGAIATSLMWISFSYAGYNAAVYVSGSTTGGLTVARSMWGAALLVTIIYVTLNAVILFSTPSEDLKFQPNVLNIAANQLGGETLSRVMSWVILLSLATSVSAMLQAGPHVYAQMARDGLLPRFLAVDEGQLPRLAIVLQIVLASILAVFSTLQQLLDFLGFLLTLSSAMTVGILLLPKIRKQNRSVGLSTDLIAPLLFVLSSLLISALALRYRFSQDPTALLEALAVFRRFGQLRRISSEPPL